MRIPRRKITARLLCGAAVFLTTSIATAQEGIDVVFKIDESGSMGDDIADVQNNVVTIFNSLPAGSHVGLVGYGTVLSGPPHGASPNIPHVHTPLTDDSTVFSNAVAELVANGAVEPGYDATVGSAEDTLNESLGFRGAPYCNILITDEPSNGDTNTQQDAIDAMQDVGGIFFGIAATGAISSFEAIADQTGGQMFSLEAFRMDATPVIEGVLAACVEAVSPARLDVKPGSCPNPFKMTQRGVTPVAILGSESFDVSEIDASTVVLENDCPALRHQIEDVATPFDGDFGEPLDENACTTAGADGFPDLVLHFDSQCLANAQGQVTDREVVLWTITGTKTDGTEFEAQDVVRLMP